MGRFFPILAAAAAASAALALAPAGQAASASVAPTPAYLDTTLYRLEAWPPVPAPDSPPGAAPADSGIAIPGVDPARLEAIAAYARVRSASFLGWAGKGIHVLAREDGMPQAHAVAAPGARLRPLTAFPHRVDQWHVNPVPSRRLALVGADRGGDEAWTLRLVDLASGRERPLAFPPGRVPAVLWHQDGDAFVYTHTPAGTDRWDIRMGIPAAPPSRHGGRDSLLLSRPGTWVPLDWSPDRKRLLLLRHVSASESELHVLRLGGGGERLVRVLPEEPVQYFDHALWVRAAGKGRSGGGLGLVFTSNREGRFHRLWYLGPGEEVGRPVALTPPLDWDVEWVATGGDRRTLVFSVNEEGRSILHALRLGNPGRSTPRIERLPGIPGGIIDGAAFHPTRPEFGFTLNGAVFPSEAFTYHLGRRECRRWTESATPGLSREDFREPELVRFPAFDSADGGRRMIPAWLYLPGTPPADGSRARFPVLISIHGGPEMQDRAGFNPFVQYLAGKMGVAVLSPNVRGSSGYGMDYLRADDGYRRMDAVRDIGSALDFIATRPELDARRVAVAGRSYGGFMALASLIEHGERLRAGASTVGITHFPSFLKETSGYRRDLRRAEYGDERDPRMEAFLDSISPMTRLDLLRRPLLLAHGRNDPRVPYAESVRIFEALKSKQVPAWLLTFEREGHAFRSEESRLIHYATLAEFLAGHLGHIGK
jgi:dipeptidyl aminopeptidase/acylaminoacyl peptidase